jgi:hypothetical protein
MGSLLRALVPEGPTAPTVGALIFISVPSSSGPSRMPRVVSGPPCRERPRNPGLGAETSRTGAALETFGGWDEGIHQPLEQYECPGPNPSHPHLLTSSPSSATPPFPHRQFNHPTQSGGQQFVLDPSACRSVGDTLRKTGFGAASWTSSLQGLRLGSPKYPRNGAPVDRRPERWLGVVISH